jgi:glyoxylase-like metal-dependent hydrolase (beta-lactamase superfamily II)
VLTHTHVDHAGNLAALREVTGADVILHAAENDYLRQGWSPFPPGTNRFSATISTIGQGLARLGRFRPVQASFLIEGPQDLEEYGLPGIFTRAWAPCQPGSIETKPFGPVWMSFAGQIPHPAGDPH